MSDESCTFRILYDLNEKRISRIVEIKELMKEIESGDFVFPLYDMTKDGRYGACAVDLAEKGDTNFMYGFEVGAVWAMRNFIKDYK